MVRTIQPRSGQAGSQVQVSLTLRLVPRPWTCLGPGALQPRSVRVGKNIESLSPNPLFLQRENRGLQGEMHGFP